MKIRIPLLVTCAVFVAACASGDPAVSPPAATPLVIDIALDLSGSDSAAWRERSEQIKEILRGLHPGDVAVARPITEASYGPVLFEVRIPEAPSSSANQFDRGEILRQRTVTAARDSVVGAALAILDSLATTPRAHASEIHGAIAASGDYLALPQHRSRHRALVVLSDMRNTVDQPAGAVYLPSGIVVWIAGLRGTYSSVVAQQSYWRDLLELDGDLDVFFVPPGERLTRDALAAAFVRDSGALDTECADHFSDSADSSERSDMGRR